VVVGVTTATNKLSIRALADGGNITPVIGGGWATAATTGNGRFMEQTVYVPVATATSGIIAAGDTVTLVVVGDTSNGAVDKIVTSKLLNSADILWTDESAATPFTSALLRTLPVESTINFPRS